MTIEAQNFEQFDDLEVFCSKFKERTAGDPHWEDINCAGIEDEDVDLISRLDNGELTESDINKRSAKLEELGRGDPHDPSYALAAMLKNMLIARIVEERKYHKFH